MTDVQELRALLAAAGKDDDCPKCGGSGGVVVEGEK